MQIDFRRDQAAAERLKRLQPLRHKGVYVVVRCGGYQIIHFGTLDDFNETGTVLALNCPTDKKFGRLCG